MSQLVELLKSTKYSRLTVLPFSGQNSNPEGTAQKNYSARGQSGTNEQRQGTAVDFIPNTFQRGFLTNESPNTLSSFRKSQDSDFTRYTTRGLESYKRYVSNSGITHYRSNRVHIYDATDDSKQFSTINSTKPGITLIYNAP
jgi:hypothetical protein